jgi:putative glutamine amidotransferase
MSSISPSIRIGICGVDHDPSRPGRGWGLWSTGYASAITAAGAEPVNLDPQRAGRRAGDICRDLHGIVLAGAARPTAGRLTAEERLCLWCREQQMPILAIDHGLHVLNTTFGGSIYLDLCRELPEALQHRHPPEHGLRHAINVLPGSRLAGLYGEGEFVVNSEHRRAVQRLARGFVVSAQALDGVIEAIEPEDKNWFGLGVQWHPASATASGLDIQLFRGLVDACQRCLARAGRKRADSPKRRRALAGVA